MSPVVSKGQIQAARQVDLYEYLMRTCPDDFIREGNSLRPIDNHSISIKKGFSGYNDFADPNESGNSVDYLVRHRGMSLPDAVLALLGNTKTKSPTDRIVLRGNDVSSEFVLPSPDTPPYKRMWAYLVYTRGIMDMLVRRLISEKLLYQSTPHGNIVFVNHKQTFCELRGTVTNKPFHRIMFSDPTACWSFAVPPLVELPPGSVPYSVCICESAIDAMSLYLIHPKLEGTRVFCSVGGVANKKRIDRIIRETKAANGFPILAFDNDDAGQRCLDMYPDVWRMVPKNKDWNEDLLALKKK